MAETVEMAPRPIQRQQEDLDAQEEDTDVPDVTSKAEELADEHDIDLSEVEGSGKNSRIVTSDVRDVIHEE